MRLDENNSGGVTPHNLSRVLGNLSLKDFVGRYSIGEGLFSTFSFASLISTTGKKPTALDESLIQVTPGRELRTPLLVWVDDRPDNIAYEVAKAREMGIYVIEMASTVIAKAWVDANLCKFVYPLIFHSNIEPIPLAFLHGNDHPPRVRFISDNVRLETTSGSGTYLNPMAGESFLRYLRGRFIASPVLICTGWSIASTRYVQSYEAAGSTTNPKRALEYIMNLASGKGNDTAWRGFDS